MPAGWPVVFPSEGPIAPDDPTLDRTGGHPTVAGDLDPKTIRTQGEPSPGNGVPGKPRYRSLGKRHGPGMPGGSTVFPMSPGVDYDDGAAGA